MRVRVRGGYQSKFGELWEKSLEDLMVEAGEGAMKAAGVKREEIDWVVVGNKLSGKVTGQDHLGALAAERLGIKGGGVRVEAACASGGVAVHEGIKAIKSGEARRVLVIGVEKMTDKSNGEIAEALMGAASEAERRAGLSFVGLYALMARAYMDKYGLERKDLVKVAVKNHRQARLNPKAQFGYEITEKMALEAGMVAEPLGLFDCSPISDGAAGVVIEGGEEIKRGEVEVLASEMATDKVGLAERRSLTELKASQEASKRAYEKAGVKAEEIEIAEVHDCFTIAEIMAYEDLGFCKKGEGKAGVKLGVNLSGGLKACGHPVGATGVKQIAELWLQLEGKAGVRQREGVRLGLSHNVGGTGGTAVVHILRRQE